MPLLLEGVDADGVLEDDGAPLGVVVELHRVVVDGAGVVGGVHQQLAVVRVQRVQVKPCEGKCSISHGARDEMSLLLRWGGRLCRGAGFG